MEITIVEGYGEETTPEKQREFLMDFKSFISSAGLHVNAIRSERPTGGPITLGVPDYVEPQDITRAFLSIAKGLAQQRRWEAVKFVLSSSYWPIPVEVIGDGS